MGIRAFCIPGKGNYTKAMTTASSHHPGIPPELRKSPPRAVRLRPHWFRNNWGRVLGFGLLLLIGAGLVIYGAADITFLMCAPVVTGRVTSTSMTRSARGTPTYTIVYAYKTGDEIHSNSQDVSAAFFQLIGAGNALPISTIAVAGWRYDEIRLSRAEYFQERGWVWGIAMVPGILLTLALRFYWLQPRRLIRMGAAVAGVITKKHVRNSGRSGPTYQIFYDYTDMQNLGWANIKRAVSHAAYEAVHQGEHVVVLCDPYEPGRSLVYKCSAFEAV
jgi:hypothetical protein